MGYIDGDTYVDDGLSDAETIRRKIMENPDQMVPFTVGSELPKNLPKDPILGFKGAGQDILNIAEFFGIEKKEVGKMLLKSIATGKLGIDLFKETTPKKKGFERAVAAIKDIAWIPLVYIIAYQLLQLFIVKVS